VLSLLPCQIPTAIVTTAPKVPNIIVRLSCWLSPPLFVLLPVGVLLGAVVVVEEVVKSKVVEKIVGLVETKVVGKATQRW
jgi:hypothetical protein